MNRPMISAMMAGLIVSGAYSFADDQAQQGTQASQSYSDANGKDKMEQCMSRQKASNSGLTNEQMQTTCKNEAKAGKTRKNGNDLATGPQADEKPQH